MGRLTKQPETALMSREELLQYVIDNHMLFTMAEMAETSGYTVSQIWSVCKNNDLTAITLRERVHQFLLRNMHLKLDVQAEKLDMTVTNLRYHYKKLNIDPDLAGTGVRPESKTTERKIAVRRANYKAAGLQKERSYLGPIAQAYFEAEKDPIDIVNDAKLKIEKSAGKIAMILVFVLSTLGGTGQTSPVAWAWKAVRVDSNYFEFHLIADIFRGWWIYKPNKPNLCEYSPIISFEGSSGVQTVGEVDVIEGFLCSNDSEEPPFCPLPKYKDNAIFVQVFKLPITKCGIVRGTIRYKPLSQYMSEPLRTVRFELKVGECGPMVVHPMIITTYPKGPIRKAWWFIRHPLGPPYIKRTWY